MLFISDIHMRGYNYNESYYCCEGLSCKYFTKLMYLIINYETSLDFFRIKKHLMKHIDTINAQNELGLTALMICCAHSKSIDIIKLLLKNKADPNIQDNQINTALMFAACYHDNIKVVKLLKNYSANIDHTNVSKRTALSYIYTHHTKNIFFMKELLLQGANINLKITEYKYTLFMLISANLKNLPNNMEILEYVLRHGADVNTTCIYNWTAIFYAAKYCVNGHNISTIKLLLYYGADPDHVNNEGKIFLDYLEDASKPEIIDYVKKFKNAQSLKSIINDQLPVHAYSILYEPNKIRHLLLLTKWTLHNNPNEYKYLLDKYHILRDYLDKPITDKNISLIDKIISQMD
ncbi:putative ankyrin repeat protein [Cotonvirus japonicus]|uniref:Ankyrin repeat protein n=1 Tax=Cotonvirus japonicus TaxID=2811091 RepID=A0ABM7NRA9_9VIRU|nr:putative ankyrin repeat protein [Cotonvirus japonicus]BCS82627.1 putative ankyrin repeat protein [Cotonvirus japonicus]